MGHIIIDDSLFLILKVYRELLNRPKSSFYTNTFYMNRRKAGISRKISKTMSNEIFEGSNEFSYDFEQ